MATAGNNDLSFDPNEKENTVENLYESNTEFNANLAFHAQALIGIQKPKDGGKKGRLKSMHKGGWKRKLKQRFISD